MTGPETKVLQGYGALALQHAKPDEAGKHPGNPNLCIYFTVHFILFFRAR